MWFFTQGEAHTRSIIKAVSWRITASIDTFVISFFGTHPVTAPGQVALSG
jgi:hypothetical protein